MRILKTNTLVSLLTAASIAVAPGLAFADNGTAVINSGDNASVTSSTNQTSHVAVSNSNTAFTTQSVNADANSGGNTANSNIGLNGGGGTILTGAANIGAQMGVNANHNVTSVSGATSPASSNVTDVVNTGDNAHVNTTANTSNVVQVDNSNVAAVEQAFKAKANSGLNVANKNIGGGTIGTGGANIGATMGTDVNHNTTSVGGFGGLSGLSNGLVNGTSITNTGDHSTVHSSANSNSTVGVSNYNHALVNQGFFGASNTGKNAANSNIGGGLIGTGAANVGATMGVSANSNVTGIDSSWSGGLGTLMSGDNLHDIINTGDSLDSNTSVNNTSSVGVSNSQFLASTQYQWSHSNSGLNDAVSNIGGTGIGTSVANAGGTFGIAGNTNLTGIGGFFGDLLSLMGMF
ncbi:MAG: hypothetical protein RI947_411 [Candidatus Parcubacteria bacterium]|jgi:hypothetical protein